MNNRNKAVKVNLYLLVAILIFEVAIIWKHSEDKLDHAYFDSNAKLILCCSFAIFLVLFCKIGISDLKKKLTEKGKKIGFAKTAKIN